MKKAKVRCVRCGHSWRPNVNHPKRCRKCCTIYWSRKHINLKPGGPIVRLDDGRRAKDLALRFWAKVLKTDQCWNWQGSLNPCGYGQVGIIRNGKHTNGGAHRVSYELTHGDIPKGLWVLHHCDNRKCVNPSHLYLGNAMDNARDRAVRGRAACGSRSHNGKEKLTADSVREIRAALLSGMNQSDIAKQFSVHQSNISHVKRGITWRHVI